MKAAQDTVASNSSNVLYVLWARSIMSLKASYHMTSRKLEEGAPGDFEMCSSGIYSRVWNSSTVSRKTQGPAVVPFYNKRGYWRTNP